MRRILVSLALAAAALMALVTAVPAQAATGRVVVFSTELTPLSVYENPEGCHTFPPLAHVLANETDGVVRIYGDPFCLGPAVTVLPGYGLHVPEGSGSFSA